MKKRYIKPSMEVYELKGHSQILAGSAPEYPYDFGYTPGQPKDEKTLA